MTDLDTGTLDRFHQRLLVGKVAIDGLLERSSADSRPVDLGLPIGRLSRIDAIQMQGVAQLDRRRLESRRERVTVALAAVDEGAHGSCRACRQPIDLARLEAQPEVPFCLPCQESFEQDG